MTLKEKKEGTLVGGLGPCLVGPGNPVACWGLGHVYWGQGNPWAMFGGAREPWLGGLDHF